MSIKKINAFINEKQYCFKIKLAEEIKKEDYNIYQKIINGDNLIINNKDYFLDKNNKKYILR